MAAITAAPLRPDIPCMRQVDMKTQSRTLVLVGVAVALAACSSTAGSSPTASSTATSTTTTTITGTLTEYKIELSATSAPAGTVIFNVTNAGTIVHEFVILKTDTLAKDVPLAGDSVDEGAFNAIGEVEETEPGGSGTFTATLEPGHYAIICNVPGHVSQGMVTDFTVN